MSDKNDDRPEGSEPEILSPEKAAEAMGALDEVMKNLGATKRDPENPESTSSAKNIKLDASQVGQLPEMMLNLFATAIQEAQKKAPSSAAGEPAKAKDESSKVINLDEEREKRGPRQPTELEKKLQEGLKSTFKGYVNDKVAPDATPGTDIPVDGDFLKEHGPALMGALLKSLATSVLPEDKQIRIPIKGEKDGDEKPVSLKLDLNSILSKLTTPPTKK